MKVTVRIDAVSERGARQEVFFVAEVDSEADRKRLLDRLAAKASDGRGNWCVLGAGRHYSNRKAYVADEVERFMLEHLLWYPPTFRLAAEDEAGEADWVYEVRTMVSLDRYFEAEGGDPDGRESRADAEAIRNTNPNSLLFRSILEES